MFRQLRRATAGIENQSANKPLNGCYHHHISRLMVFKSKSGSCSHLSRVSLRASTPLKARASNMSSMTINPDTRTALGYHRRYLCHSDSMQRQALMIDSAELAILPVKGIEADNIRQPRNAHSVPVDDDHDRVWLCSCISGL